MEDGTVEVAELGDDGVLLRLRGEFDASTSIGHLAIIDEIATISEVRRVEIDAADVSFIDSSGLRILLTMVLAVRDSGGTVSTVNASTQFQRLLHLSGLTEMFGLRPA